MTKKQTATMDGNAAAAYAAYAFTEVAAIYPITPSSPMADSVDKYSTAGRENIFGTEVQVVEMQSEAGVAGAVHGALASGALATTFTSSQGLLLMIPNMYKMAGELLPSVIHVASRTIATHALSILGDHSDIYACRQTGYAMLCANNPQEAFHMSAISHLSAISGGVPFVHFFDGFRTSHEIQKVELLDYEDLKEILDINALENFRKNSLNPEHPSMRGTAQNDDVFFQNREACNKYYDKIPEIVETYMNKINEKAGTNYKIFNYYGDKNAERIIIAMGSVCETTEETIDYLAKSDEKVGLIKVHLYRPFSAEHLIKALPETVKTISVLDRTKESGSIGEPLYLDVLAALKKCGKESIKIYSGRYGLSSKNVTPGQILSVYENMNSENPKVRFTIGIEDDVTHLSLKIKNAVDTTPEGTYSCKFWGIGSDGTIGAAKNTIKIIGDNTEKYIQAFFSYDSKKSGGVTVSHLRYGDKPIKSTYFVDRADFVACHTPRYIYKYEILKDLKPSGNFLLNCSWNDEELSAMLPDKVKKYIAENDINFYILDAVNLTRQVGLGGRVNTMLQAAFFKINGIFEGKCALELIKEALTLSYGKKGEEVIKINHLAAEKGMQEVRKIDVPQEWKDLNISSEKPSVIQNTNSKLTNFVQNILEPIAEKKGDDLPVSAFEPYVDGTIPLGSAAFEKRGTASFIPHWILENCIQCGLCSYVCPHAVIRPMALTDDEISKAPKSLQYKKMIGIPNLNFSIVVSAKDCTGCENCVAVCPGLKKNKALKMNEASKEIVSQEAFDYAINLPLKPEVFQKFKETTIKGSQFKKPLLEFSGACAGCGETPYAKLATQLFGDRMYIANATGCSSIWSGSFPSSAYTVNQCGKGPAWQNSLFEDNAEFGYGIALAEKAKKSKIINLIKQIEKVTKTSELKEICAKYLSTINDSSENQLPSEKLINYLESNKKTDVPQELTDELIKNKDQISKKTIWMFGGDGWAYDIGFGGLDHVIATGENVNILILDTEIYSNTGGQTSKATPEGAIAGFASSGKTSPKKNLAAIAMTYEHVYVAKVALGADYNQCIKAFAEAESYNGPSIIIAYSPCINHGIRGGMKNSPLSSKEAVESGYWNLFRFDPRNKEKGKPPLILDSKPASMPFKNFLLTQNRFSALKNLSPQKFELIAEESEKHSEEQYQFLEELSE